MVTGLSKMAGKMSKQGRIMLGQALNMHMPVLDISFLSQSPSRIMLLLGRSVRKTLGIGKTSLDLAKRSKVSVHECSSVRRQQNSFRLCKGCCYWTIRQCSILYQRSIRFVSKEWVLTERRRHPSYDAE